MTQQVSRRKRRRDLLAVLMDLISFGVGISLIIRQGWYVSREEFNWVVLLFGGMMVQVPGMAQFVSILRTPSLPSQLPPEDSPHWLRQLPSGSPEAESAGDAT